ncbi:MAG TPA: hypothetical protein EYP52_06185 [Anaerolineae bacterium]|nr:hypothetical protein [Anaerolineae bacterium]
MGTNAENNEQEVHEPRVVYGTVIREGKEEQPAERLLIQFPPYFDRFLEERDRRLTSELGRLEAAIRQNTERIDRLAADMDRRITELAEMVDRRFAEVDQRFISLAKEMDRRFAEVDRRFAEARAEREVLRAEIQALRREMQTQFRWSIGLLLPIVGGIVLIIVRVFFGGG